MIDQPHSEAGATLTEWIVGNYKPGQPLHVTVVCTGNTRRSILGATMGNVAAAYYGFPEVRFHSGGTAPTAFNHRTVMTLRDIGIEVEPTGDDAPRGEPATANPFYRVRWGQAGATERETIEFSKLYNDTSNPQNGFAALMVCGEADAGCPIVKGASVRVSMPYLDPKIYDGGTYESLKYAERRDDMGRLMMSVMMRVRHHKSRAMTGDCAQSRPSTGRSAWSKQENGVRRADDSQGNPSFVRERSSRIDPTAEDALATMTGASQEKFAMRPRSRNQMEGGPSKMIYERLRS